MTNPTNDLKTLWETHHSGNPNLVKLGKAIVKVHNLMNKSAINGQQSFYAMIDNTVVDTLIIILKSQFEGLVIGRVSDEAKTHSFGNKTKLKVSMAAFLK